MNGFERHKIEHLSPSAICTWRRRPEQWVMRYLYGRKFQGSASMSRGQAVEDGIAYALFGMDEDGISEELRQNAHSVADDIFCERTACLGEPPDVTRRERGRVFQMIDNGLTELAPYGPPEEAPGANQHKVSRTLQIRDALSVLMVGYLDFWWPEAPRVVDLKTMGAIKRTLQDDHAIQGAFYGVCTGADVRFLYVSAASALWHDITPDIARTAIEEMKFHAARLEEWLRRFERDEIARLIPVDPSDWQNKQSLDDMREIFGLPAEVGQPLAS